MRVLAARVTLRLSGIHSLKDKRSVVQKVTSRIAHRFPVAVAEVDHQDDRRLLVLGLAAVGTDAVVLEQVLRRAAACAEAESGFEVWDLTLEVCL